MTLGPLRALDSPRVLPLEVQRHNDNVKCDALGGADIPEHLKEQRMQTLSVRLLKTHFFPLFKKLEGPRPPFTTP